MRKGIWELTFAAILVAATVLHIRASESPTTAPASAAGAAPTSATAPASKPADDGKARILKALKLKPLTEPIPGGEINRTDQEVRAVGIAHLAGHQSKDFLMAQNAARLVAARNAVLLLGGIRAGPGGNFANFREGQINVDAIVRDFRETDSDYDPKTDSVVSYIRIPFYGVSGLVRISGAMVERPAKVWAWPQPAAADGPAPQWVVIDARTCRFLPCLLPQLVTENGQSVFSPADVPPAQLAARAEAILATADATAELPASPKVLIVRAKIADDKYAGRLILDAQGVGQLSASPAARQLLIEGKFVIVTDVAR